MFGSIIKQNSIPSDIDILVTYKPINIKSYIQVLQLRHKINDRIINEIRLNADVILLSLNEEKEIDFINKSNAICVWP